MRMAVFKTITGIRIAVDPTHAWIGNGPNSDDVWLKMVHASAVEEYLLNCTFEEALEELNNALLWDKEAKDLEYGLTAGYVRSEG